MQRSSIQWTHYTSNPLKYRYLDGTVVWACVHASPGCLHCYAEQLALRWHRGKLFNVANMREVVPFVDEDEIKHILKYKPASGKMCFLGDMTDIFGDWVPDNLIDRVFMAMYQRPDVQFQILTKRAERMRDYSLGMQALGPQERAYRWAQSMYKGHPAEKLVLGNLKLENCGPVEWSPKNIWWGVSAESRKYWDERVPFLKQTPAQVRYVSYEPALGPIDLGVWDVWCLGLDWIICGGESGGGARPFDVRWANHMRQACAAAGVPFFMKQMGSVPVISAHRQAHYEWGEGNFKEYSRHPEMWRIKLKDRMGGTPAEWPDYLRVQEFPTV